MKTTLFSTILFGATVPLATTQSAEFIALDSPDGSTSVSSLSADGSTVLGQISSDSGKQIFRWTADGGFTLVPLFDPGEGFSPNFFATSISGDGGVVVGYAFNGVRTEGMRWSPATGFSMIGALPAAETGEAYSLGLDISADGNAVAASGTSPLTPFTTALYWNGTGGLIPLGFLPEDQPDEFSVSFSFAQAVSSDGRVVVGSSASTKHLDRGDQAFRWSAADGMTGLGFLPGESQSTATAVSADGTVVVGVSGLNAFRWTAESGLENIGNFFPTGVSADGNVVIGVAQSEIAVATIWTREAGAQALQTVLENKLNQPLGWQSLDSIAALSDDGLVLTGNGRNAAGLCQAFVADLSSDDLVVSTGAISFSGAIDFFLEDPTGRAFGIDPESGALVNEILGLTLAENLGTKTAAWSDLVSGEYRVQLTGNGDSNYSLDLAFQHLDEQSSGGQFGARLLKGGVHVYAATVANETATGAQYQLIYAESDGDNVPDELDAVTYSDMRQYVFVGRINTGLANRVLRNGATLNDLIQSLLNSASNARTMQSTLKTKVKKWEHNDVITEKELKKLLKAIEKLKK